MACPVHMAITIITLPCRTLRQGRHRERRRTRLALIKRPRDQQPGTCEALAAVVRYTILTAAYRVISCQNRKLRHFVRSMRAHAGRCPRMEVEYLRKDDRRSGTLNVMRPLDTNQGRFEGRTRDSSGTRAWESAGRHGKDYSVYFFGSYLQELRYFIKEVTSRLRCITSGSNYLKSSEERNEQ